jgi:hypothetical protein
MWHPTRTRSTGPNTVLPVALSRLRLSAALVLWLAALASCAAAQDTPSAAEATPVRDRDARLEFLRQRADQFTVSRRGEHAAPLTRLEEPLLRYSNPVRAIDLSDGALFLWHDGVRPAAILSLSIRSQGSVYRELSVLCDQPLDCARDEAVLWSPAVGGFAWQSLTGAPAPAGSAARRLTQLRGLARRFSGVYFKPQTDEPFELRVMPQPIHRYGGDAAGAAVDGAIFALAEANDPEILLLIETRIASPEAPAWRYAIGRMSSTRLVVRLDGREVWSVTNFWKSPRTPELPYLEAADGMFEAPAAATPQIPETPR